MGDVLDLHAFRRCMGLASEDPAFDRHMERAEKALGPAATIAWERFSAVAAGILDAQSGADSLDEAVRRFQKVDAAVALLAFARMIASADADDQEDLRTRFLEAYVIAYHGQIE